MKPHAPQVRGGVCERFGSIDLSPTDRFGARLIVTRMLIESEIEILWQIFLRKVDSETIFLTRYSIESSNMSLAEFEAD